MKYDIAIIGGGPAGLQAALTLGRADKRILLFDAGPRRNAAAQHIHNFVTRDGATPDEFRQRGRAQLEPYPVEIRDVRVERITGEKDDFEIRAADGEVTARRLLVCTGMVDERLDIPGFAELWGHRIFQCPYCHGWEVRGRPWTYLATNTDHLQFAALLQGWTQEVHVLLHGVELTAEQRAQPFLRGVRVHDAAITRLEAAPNGDVAITLTDDTKIQGALFAHPPQRQVPLVESLELDLDEGGYVRVDPMTQQTSRPGIYAAGDLQRPQQAVAFAVSAAAHAAGMVNFELSLANAST